MHLYTSVAGFILRHGIINRGLKAVIGVDNPLFMFDCCKPGINLSILPVDSCTGFCYDLASIHDPRAAGGEPLSDSLIVQPFILYEGNSYSLFSQWVDALRQTS